MKCTGKLGRGGRAGWKKVPGASGASKRGITGRRGGGDEDGEVKL